MRTLSFIFVLIIAAGVSAQSPAAKISFIHATKLANSGAFEEARQSYRNALKAAERANVNFRARLHYNLGVCEYRLNNNANAIEEFRLAIALKGGKYSRAFYATGMAETARENWPAARQAFLEALKLDRTDGKAWFDLAVAYLGEKDIAGAEAAFRNSIMYKSTDSALSHNNIGVILGWRGNLTAAEKEFEAALKLSDDTLLEARKNLAYCRAREHRHDSLLAKAEFEITGRTAVIF